MADTIDEWGTLSGVFLPVGGVCRLHPDEQTKEITMALRIVSKPVVKDVVDAKKRLREHRDRKAREPLKYKMKIDVDKLELKKAA